MHELTVCEQLLTMLSREKRRRGFCTVASLKLEVGYFSCLDPDAFCYAFDIASSGTFLEGAKLLIERPLGHARCLDCGHENWVDSYLANCAGCGGSHLDISSGDQLRLIEMNVRWPASTEVRPSSAQDGIDA